MNWIEALGPPSVGKSYLLNRLIKVAVKNDLKREWLAEKEWAETVTPNLKFNQCNNLYQKILLIYSQQNIFSYKKHGCQTVLLNKISQGLLNIEESHWAYYMENHLKGVCESNYPAFQKLFLIEGYSRLLKKLYFYSLRRLEKAVYIDEGPIHNNFGLDQSFKISANSDRPALIIHYKEGLEIILSRIKKKETETGKRCVWYKGLNDNGLRKKIEEVNSFTNAKVIHLKKNNIPVLEIKSADVNDDNKILEILVEINSKLSESN